MTSEYGTMIAFMHATTAGQPVWLCEDVRRHIHALSLVRRCTRCDRLLEVVRCDGRKRIRACYVPHGVTCFECCHRLRWPRP